MPDLYMKKPSRNIVLSETDQNLLSELKLVVSKHVPDAVVLIYGSVARGTATSESDYDLLVITHNKLSRNEEDALDTDIYQLQLEQDVVFSVSIITSDEWEQPMMRVSTYHRNVTKDAIAI